jgi:tetratricopeptide (TPR) repeat protein
MTNRQTTLATGPGSAPTARRSTPLALRAVGLLAMAVAVAGASQLLVAARQGAGSDADRLASADDVGSGSGPGPADLDVGGAGAGAIDPGATTDADTARIRENITFWSGKLTAHPNDFVAAEKLGESHIELARSTGDLSAYAAAEQAFTTALTLSPGLPAARAYQGVVLVALHRFVEASELAAATLADEPDDPTSLATLGDATLELGDVAAARKAYDRLAVVAPGAAASARLGHIAFITGDVATAVRQARAAAAAADEEEDGVGERPAFYRYQLADTLLATGDRAGAATAYREALARHPRSFLAHAGLGRVLAADGKLDEAIAELDASIAIVPQPDVLARRADVFELRNAAGDAARAAQDRGTILAIAELSAASGSVHDRTLALYLANHRLEPQRAVDLATAELQARKDVYGYDALAWALLAAGRPAEADAAMQSALAFGTRDAKLLYHAGMIRLALGDVARAREHIEAALALDPSFDALQAARAREALARL